MSELEPNAQAQLAARCTPPRSSPGLNVPVTVDTGHDPLSDQGPVTFAVAMLDGFDAAGHDLITDWLTAIHAYLGH